MNIVNNLNNPLIYVIAIVGIFLGFFIFIYSSYKIGTFINSNTPDIKISDRWSRFVGVFSDFFTSIKDWLNAPKKPKEPTLPVDYPTKVLNFFISIRDAVVYFFVSIFAIIAAIPLDVVLPYIVAALIIILIFYPLYGKKIYCKGRCVEHFTTDNTTFADGENEVLEQDEEDTPLITAIKNGTIKETDDDTDTLLIEENTAEINSNGSTPLMWASRNGYLEIVNKIIELNDGSTINTQNNYGKTALMWAAKYSHFEIVQVLINNSADVTLNDTDGRTARDYAVGEDIVLAIDIANENIKNSSRLEKPDDYTDPEWVNVQLQKIKQEVRFNILREKPELLGDETALTEEVERVMLESQELEDTILQKAQNIQERNELTKEIQKSLITLGKETTLADMERTDIQDLAAAYSSGEYTADTSTKGALDRYDIQYHDTEETIKKEFGSQMLKESNIPYVKDGEVNELNRLYVQNQPHHSSSLSNPVLLLERIHPTKRIYENGTYVPDYENSILLSALRPKLKQQ